jgi:hypothetical protein
MPARCGIKYLKLRFLFMYNVKNIALSVLAAISSNAFYAADLQRVKDSNNKKSSVEADKKAEKAKQDRYLRENLLPILSVLHDLSEYAKRRAELYAKL